MIEDTPEFYAKVQSIAPTVTDQQYKTALALINRAQPDATEDDILESVQQFVAKTGSGVKTMPLPALGNVPAPVPLPAIGEMPTPTPLGGVVPPVPAESAPTAQPWDAKRQALMDQLQTLAGTYQPTMDAAKTAATSPGQEIASRIGAIVGGTRAQSDITAEMEAKRKSGMQEAQTEFERKQQSLTTQLDIGERGEKAKRDAEKAQRESEVYQDEKVKRQQERDPTSQQSQLARDLALKMNPQMAGKIDGMSADQINTLMPSMTKIYDIEEKKATKEADRIARAEDQRQRNLDRDAQRQMSWLIHQDNVQGRALQREIAATAKEEQQTEQQLNKLAKVMEDPQGLAQSVNNIETKLGFSLNDFDAKTGLVKGKPVDMPGVSVFGVGRVNFYNSDARELHGAISQAFNMKLKERSGAAVSNTELIRLRDEFNSGKFNTEKEMLGALQEYRRQVAAELQNRAAGFAPKVVEQYAARGGLTAADVPVNKPLTKSVPGGGTTMNTIKVISPDGKMGSIPAANIDAALAKGYRRAE